MGRNGQSVLFSLLFAAAVQVVRGDLLSPDYIEVGQIDLPVTEGNPNVPNITFAAGLGNDVLIGFTVTPAYPTSTLSVGDISINVSSISNTENVLARLKIASAVSAWSIKSKGIVPLQYFFSTTGGPSNQLTEAYVYMYGRSYGSIPYQTLKFGKVPLPSSSFLAAVDVLTGAVSKILAVDDVPATTVTTATTTTATSSSASVKDSSLGGFVRLDIISSTGEVVLLLFNPGSLTFHAQKWTSSMVSLLFDVDLGFGLESVSDVDDISLKFFPSDSTGAANYIVSYDGGILCFDTDQGGIQFSLQIEGVSKGYADGAKSGQSNGENTLSSFLWVRYGWEFSNIVSLFEVNGTVSVTDKRTGIQCGVVSPSQASYMAILINSQEKACAQVAIVGEKMDGDYPGMPAFHSFASGEVVLRGYFYSPYITVGTTTIYAQGSNGGCALSIFDSSGALSRTSSCGDSRGRLNTAQSFFLINNHNIAYLIDTCSKSFSFLGASVLCDEVASCDFPSNNTRIYVIAAFYPTSVAFASSFTTPGAPPTITPSPSMSGDFVVTNFPLCGSVTLGSITTQTITSKNSDYGLGQLDDRGNCEWLENVYGSIWSSGQAGPQGEEQANLLPSTSVNKKAVAIRSQASNVNKFVDITGVTPSGTATFVVTPLDIQSATGTVTVEFGGETESVDMSKYDICSNTLCTAYLQSSIFQPLHMFWTRQFDGEKLNAVPIVFGGTLGASPEFFGGGSDEGSFVLGNGYTFFFLNSQTFQGLDKGTVSVYVNGRSVYSDTIDMTSGRPLGFIEMATSGLHIFSMVAGGPVASLVFPASSVVLSPQLGYNILSSSEVLLQGQYCGDVTIAHGYFLRGVEYSEGSGRDKCTHHGIDYEWRYFVWIVTKMGDTKVVADTEEYISQIRDDGNVFLVSSDFLGRSGATQIRAVSLVQSYSDLALAIGFSVGGAIFFLAIILFVFCRRYRDAQKIKRQFQRENSAPALMINPAFLPDSSPRNKKSSGQKESGEKKALIQKEK